MRISKIWLITLLLAVFMAGCGGGNTPYSGGGPALPGDTTPPTVRSTDPGDTATGVGTNSKLVANFSEAVDPATCTNTTFTVTSASGTVSCAGKTATFVPTGALTAGAHTATLTTGIKDLAGNALAATTWNFTTGAADNTAPTVTSTDPADTATSVPVSTNITATFSEAVDPATATTTTFTLTQLQSTGPGCAFTPPDDDPCPAPPPSPPLIDGTVSSTGSVATFVPTITLKTWSTNPNPPSNGGLITPHYMATVTTGVKDLAGNPLAIDHAWSFTPRFKVTGGAALVALGAADGFAVLAKTGVADTSASAITGDVGASPSAGSTIGVTCAEVTGLIHSADVTGPLPCRVTDASLLATAVSDMDNAYTDAAGRTTPAPTVDPFGGNIGGQTLAPGLYKWTTAVTIPTNVTLSGTNADDVWVLQIASDLTVSNGVTVVLGGAAQAKNVFWQVGGQATLGATATFNGTILSQTSISLGAGAVLNGRALAKTTVTLNTNTVSRP